ncbi:unnamed protein product [Phyllotreta striolata]|uniref:Tropomyosin n=1 Tax=Phyllotreta striolata TaxID=444603 RepID=A0A9N9U0W8_PHYSR|nr:unnamed protein product [Phyllotreta striolata]
MSSEKYFPLLPTFQIKPTNLTLTCHRSETPANLRMDFLDPSGRTDVDDDERIDDIPFDKLQDTVQERVKEIKNQLNEIQAVQRDIESSDAELRRAAERAGSMEEDIRAVEDGFAARDSKLRQLEEELKSISESMEAYEASEDRVNRGVDELQGELTGFAEMLKDVNERSNLIEKMIEESERTEQ